MSLAGRVAAAPAELLPRLGYAARGIVYLIVGGLALAAAVGRGGQVTGTKGALRSILAQPLGDVLLCVVAVGLVAFAAWRGFQAVRDTDGHGAAAKGIAVRAGLLVSAVLHALLAAFALSLVFGWGYGSGEDDGARNWTAALLARPFGQWLVTGVGLAIAAAGVAHIVKGWRADFTRRFAIAPRDLRWASPISRFGLIARGFVFVIIGGFFGVAALYHDPGSARGLEGALRSLQAQPYGWVLLAVVALGLAAFGVYSCIESAYRRLGSANAAHDRPLSRFFRPR